MPPKASEKKNKQEEEICIICDSTILEENEDDKGMKLYFVKAFAKDGSTVSVLV